MTDRSRERMHTDIASALGGMAAEECMFGSYAGGCQDDLAKATTLAATCICLSGVGSAIVSYGAAFEDGEDVDVARLPLNVRDEINCLLEEQLQTARDTVKENLGVLEQIADEVVAKGSIGREDILRIWSGTYDLVSD